MNVKNNYLFNFAVSYGGGGFKRLYEYAKWFNKNGGAIFIIHPKCENLRDEFPQNRFFVVNQSKHERIFNDCNYLNNIRTEFNTPELYYSYGIPIYFKFGIINWFHLSNILPLFMRNIPLPIFDKFKLRYLGFKIKNNYQNADVISAESYYSLGLIESKQTTKLFLSVNGSDDEIALLQSGQTAEKYNHATIVGTYKYKALMDSYRVFEMLSSSNQQLKLIIIGDTNNIPSNLKSNNKIIIKGLLPRSEVIDCLKKTKYYISTTYIENSSNASSEGIFFADESYISDIGPHRELLKNMPFNQIAIPHMVRPMLHVKRESISGANLKTWDTVINDMIKKVNQELDIAKNKF